MLKLFSVEGRYYFWFYSSLLPRGPPIVPLYTENERGPGWYLPQNERGPGWYLPQNERGPGWYLPQNERGIFLI